MTTKTIDRKGAKKGTVGDKAKLEALYKVVFIGNHRKSLRDESAENVEAIKDLRQCQATSGVQWLGELEKSNKKNEAAHDEIKKSIQGLDDKLTTLTTILRPAAAASNMFSWFFKHKVITGFALAFIILAVVGAVSIFSHLPKGVNLGDVSLAQLWSALWSLKQ